MMSSSTNHRSTPRLRGIVGHPDLIGKTLRRPSPIVRTLALTPRGPQPRVIVGGLYAAIGDQPYTRARLPPISFALSSPPTPAGVAERLHTLRVGQQPDRARPVRAPHAAVETERVEDVRERVPDVAMRKGPARKRARAGDLDRDSAAPPTRAREVDRPTAAPGAGGSNGRCRPRSRAPCRDCARPSRAPAQDGPSTAGSPGSRPAPPSSARASSPDPPDPPKRRGSS